MLSLFFLVSLSLTAANAFDVIKSDPYMSYQDERLLPFAAIYNGTLTLQQTANTSPKCNIIDPSITNYSIFIGPNAPRTYLGSVYDRSKWDPNPFWFSLTGPTSKNNTWLNVQSSAGGFNSTPGEERFSGDVFWNFTATPRDGGWDLKGAHAKMSVLYNRFSLTSCSKSLTNWKIYLEDTWTMTGRLTSESIRMDIIIGNWTSSGVTYGRQFTFEGKLDPTKPKVVSGEKVTVEGVNAVISLDETLTPKTKTSDAAAIAVSSIIFLAGVIMLLIT